MHYPHEVIHDIRTLNDIVDVISSYGVQLRLQGGRHFGLCPFHSEKSASFCVNGEEQMFYCFGCHAGGNVITFVMRHENMDFLDALKLLADRVHYNLPDAKSSTGAKIRARERERTAELNKQAARFYYEQLQQDSTEAELARSYLMDRGVHISLQKRFGLGLAPPGWDNLIAHISAPGSELATAGLAAQSQKNQSRYYDRFRRRLMFPIIESTGRIVGFGGRALPGGDDGEAKYINSPDTPLFNKSRQLYGLNIARKSRANEMIIVEGYMDVLALHQVGFTNTVGVLGTALTAEHVRLLKRASINTVTLLLDSDEAGTRAAEKAIPELLSGGLSVKVLQFSPETGAKDPDEYIQLNGRDKFSRLLTAAKSHVAFKVGLLKHRYALDSESETNQRIRFTEEAASLLTSLTSAIETDAYAQEIADISGITTSAILAEVQKQRAQQIKSQDGQTLIIPTSNRQRVRTSAEEKGLKEARKRLMNLLFTYPVTASALAKSEYLSPEEMCDETYSQLLVLAFANAQSKRHMPPADIIAHFEILEDQQKVAEIFAGETLYKSDIDMEKALNEMAFIIKRAWFTNEMDVLMQKNDLNAVNNLFLSKRNLSSLYITMGDG
ncbi:MAG: DNA primase [Defluviitaleaceae bacterium]|nr:DNA primase [Defluviitaleaceae bacterium]